MNAPDKNAARRAFERAAPTFDAHAVLHREVGRRLIEHLDAIRIDPARIVDLGCGTGGSFALLAERFPRAELLGVDFVPAMLSRARNRASWWQRVRGTAPRLACADVERLPIANASASLAFSNLALPWCNAEAVFAESSRVLAVEGLFMFATLGPDTLMELRDALGPGNVPAFTDMHDLGDALVHAGFADPVMEMERITLEYESLEALVQELVAVGGLGAMPRDSRPPDAHAWAEAKERYDARRRGGSLPLTCEVVYGHAWKVPPKRLADGRQVVGFHPRTP